MGRLKATGNGADPIHRCSSRDATDSISPGAILAGQAGHYRNEGDERPVSKGR